LRHGVDGGPDLQTGRGNFQGVWPIAKHCKTSIFGGCVKRRAVCKNWWTDLNDLYACTWHVSPEERAIWGYRW